MLIATASGNNILLKISDASNYSLERRINTGSWEAWDGSAWGGVPANLNTENFTDYDLSDGVYQYRYTTTETVYSNCIPIGSASVGWTFRNYNVPVGQFGEILTADDMNLTYLFGIDLTASNGQPWTNEQTEEMIEWSVVQLERILDIDISPREYYADDEENVSIVPVAHSVVKEFPYPNRRHQNYNIRMRHRPVREVTRFDFYSPVDTKIIDLIPWMRLDKRNGQLYFYPKQGTGKTFTSYGWPWNLIIGALGYRDAFHINYTTGYETAEFLPEDLRDIIGKIAACKMLNIIGDGLLAGFSSSSLSLDGISESFSSTQSATNAFFGSRIQVYLKDIKEFVEANRNKYGNFRIGSI